MFYLNNPWFRTPKASLKAIKYKGKLYPCTYQDTKKPKTFIYGEGWVQDKNFAVVPLFKFDGDISFESYLEKYGAECLYYSLTGYSLDDVDTAAMDARHEFRSLLLVGLEYMQQYWNDAHQLNAKIEAKLIDFGIRYDQGRFTNVGDRAICLDDIFKFIPRYSIFNLFVCAPTVDPLEDDILLLKHCRELYDYNSKDFQNFPDSVKDRLTYLFGEEISNNYETMLKKYPLTKPNCK